MKKSIQFLALLAAILGSVAGSGLTAKAADLVSDDLINTLYAMRGVYRAEYAPAAWKKSFANYDLDTEFDRAIAAAKANPALTLAEARGILKNFIYAMKDYHTSISFVSTEAATLPLTIKAAGKQAFIAYIDRKKLSEDSFPFAVGDEVVTFGGKPTTQVIAEVQAEIPANVPGTDLALAELRLTSRAAARGYNVPQGPVTLGIKRQGSDSVSEIQLIWDYTPEKIFARGPLTSSTVNSLMPAIPGEEHTSIIPQSALFSPMMNISTKGLPSADNPHGLGTKQSYLPALGLKVWQAEKSNTYDAYIYKTADRRLIGYVRIASYVQADYAAAVADFAKIITLFESTTDAMVIDQLNNPGGSVFYLYALASMLSDQPLKAPRHRMAINQQDVSDALNTIEQLKGIKTDDDAKTAIGPDDLNGFTPSYEFVQFYLNYSQFIVDEWKAGRKLTKPFWIAGVDHINPSATHYTKPIVVLTNHLDFSGGDFFPTILQDNKRITIVGSRTAGAGGYVNDIKIQNNLGIASFRCTESIAERVDGNPIENLGVVPDVEYEFTADDYTQNYAPYVKKVKATVEALAK